jgi:PD-(D/E)XK nuclease superfamily
MTKLPEPLNTTAAAIYALHEKRTNDEDPRGYLGWSSIGETCPRKLWLSFHWVEKDIFSGRVARLFNSGHREEDRVLQELRDIGCTVFDRDDNGHQYACENVGGHLRGHLDAVVLGLPEGPQTPTLVDVKTIKSKLFDSLLKQGMQKQYPKYWAQAHGYMGEFNLTRAMFIFVCKDDDRIHCERFAYEPEVHAHYVERARQIIESPEPPPRIHNDPAWHECRFCQFHPHCHEKAVPLENCRTCAHSTPHFSGDASWVCEKYDTNLTFEHQRLACPSHRFIPILLEKHGTLANVEGDDVVYRLHDGTTLINGRKGMKSAEMREASC